MDDKKLVNALANERCNGRHGHSPWDYEKNTIFESGSVSSEQRTITTSSYEASRKKIGAALSSEKAHMWFVTSQCDEPQKNVLRTIGP
jgi:hypothetical protein